MKEHDTGATVSSCRAIANFEYQMPPKKDTQGKTVFKLALTQKPLHITYSNNKKTSMVQVKIQNFFHSIFSMYVISKIVFQLLSHQI